MRREIVEDKESEWGGAGRKGARQRATDNQVTHQLVHSDTVCIKKIYCNTSHFCKRNVLNINHKGILYTVLDSWVILALINIILMMQ